MKPYERLRESPSPTGESIILEFPDGNYLTEEYSMFREEIARIEDIEKRINSLRGSL
jgi:hypothetical protein